MDTPIRRFEIVRGRGKAVRKRVTRFVNGTRIVQLNNMLYALKMYQQNSPTASIMRKWGRDIEREVREQLRDEVAGWER